MVLFSVRIELWEEFKGAVVRGLSGAVAMISVRVPIGKALVVISSAIGMFNGNLFLNGWAEYVY